MDFAQLIHDLRGALIVGGVVRAQIGHEHVRAHLHVMVGHGIVGGFARGARLVGVVAHVHAGHGVTPRPVRHALRALLRPRRRNRQNHRQPEQNMHFLWNSHDGLSPYPTRQHPEIFQTNLDAAIQMAGLRARPVSWRVGKRQWNENCLCGGMSAGTVLRRFGTATSPVIQPKRQRSTSDVCSMNYFRLRRMYS